MEKLSIVYRSVDELIPYVRNSRTHSDAQVAQIAGSIREFGWTNPILVDGESGIIAGHGRLMAARKLGLKEVPTIELSGLDENQRRAYVIADNQLATLAGWDDELLAVELQALKDADFDMSLLGWGDNLPDFATAPDYSVLEDEDMDEQLDEMASGVKRGLMLEFEQEHYEEALALVKYWRSRQAYVGMMLIDKLRSEKDKL